MPRTAAGPSCPQEDSGQKLPPAPRQTDPSTWLHRRARQAGLRAGSGLAVAARPLPGVGSGGGDTPLRTGPWPSSSCTPMDLPPGKSWGGRGWSHPVGRATGAPCSSHLGVRPAGLSGSSWRARSDIFLHKPSFKKSHHRSHEEGPYLPSPGRPGGGGPDCSQRRLPWEPEPGSPSQGAASTKARPGG